MKNLRPDSGIIRIKSFSAVFIFLAWSFIFFAARADFSYAQSSQQNVSGAPVSTAEEDDEFEEDEEDDFPRIPDPFIWWNKAMFQINDRLYFWVLRPTSRVYNRLLPEMGRISIRNFFENLLTPVRFFNCLLQGKLRSGGTEAARFCLNTAFGVLGFFDPAKKVWKLSMQDEDTGQTLGVYGLGHGFYLVLPFFGPSSLRDGIGMVGDGFLNPVYYLPLEPSVSITAYKTLNQTSLKLGDYEGLKKSSLDPYRSFRDIYVQYRENKVKR
ncbi:MAG: VacJ family lipoprotein [Candidatus Aureabacteria bacterium]|nr:VacJ family lipoprotein [Candidatus Auribacterota bacterium]